MLAHMDAFERRFRSWYARRYDPRADTRSDDEVGGLFDEAKWARRNNPESRPSIYNADGQRSKREGNDWHRTQANVGLSPKAAHWPDPGVKSGIILPDRVIDVAMTPEEDAYHALCSDTLARRDTEFIHQHVVDAYMAQHADERTRPIALTCALVGLYLLVERGFSGKKVQRVHMQLARRKHPWPPFPLPRERGSTTALDVMRAREGPERDQAIHAWCASVWAAFADSRQTVADLLRRHGIV